MMDVLDLSAHKEELSAAGVDGCVLVEVWSLEDLTDLGLSLPRSAALTLKGKVEELRLSGVAASLLASRVSVGEVSERSEERARGRDREDLC